MAAQPPTQQQRIDIGNRLQDVLNALERHQQWQTGPGQNQTLYYVHDFAASSKKKLDDYENIQAGRPVQHPEQFRGRSGSGNATALKVFQDVCSRTMMLKMLVTGNAAGPLDFGQEVKDAVAALDAVCPEEHVMAGMMN